MYRDEDIIHDTVRNNLDIVVGWLFIVLLIGSILTIFSTISTTFSCCQKPLREDNKQKLINEDESDRKLYFPHVPRTVYPTSQSIFQQNDNEVIDSLTPAYRKLLSTHVCQFDSGYKTDGNESTACSTNNYIQENKTSLSLEKIHSNRLGCESTQLKHLLAKDEDTVNDMSKIAETENVLKNASNSSDQLRIRKLSSRNSSGNTMLPITCTQESSTFSDFPICNEHSMYTSLKHCQPECKDMKKENETLDTKYCDEKISQDESAVRRPIESKERGASSFGGIEFNSKTCAFSPDYCAFTFQREGSSLSNRRASAFAMYSGNSQFQSQPRGASSFGEPHAKLQEFLRFSSKDAIPITTRNSVDEIKENSFKFHFDCNNVTAFSRNGVSDSDYPRSNLNSSKRNCNNLATTSNLCFECQKPISNSIIDSRDVEKSITSSQYASIETSANTVINDNETKNSIKLDSKLDFYSEDPMCCDKDSILDSISLSFAYESESEEDFS